MKTVSIIDFEIESCKKSLSDKNVSSDINKVCDHLIHIIFEYTNNEKQLWISFRQAQYMIQEVTGVKNTIREALIRRCQLNGGNEREILNQLYYHLPTDEEYLLKKQKEEAYHVLGSKHNGKLIDVKSERLELSTCVSGINRSKARDYTESNGFFGGNGTYRVGYPDVELFLILIIKLPNHPHVKIDVRNQALQINNRTRVTTAFVNTLKEKLKNTDIQVEYLGGDEDKVFGLTDYSILKI